MEKKVFRVGSVGIGGISRGVHLPGIQKSPDLELVAVCDLKPERMEYARNTYGIREDHCFADYHDLIACPDVDVINVFRIDVEKEEAETKDLPREEK